MAIYHFSAKVISRANGSSAVAAAAYRSASRLEDERLGRAHDFSNKSGVVHSEIMTPEGAPERWQDRQSLWNEVEALERRKDAQLAREVEFAIPREMSLPQGVALAHDFAQEEFVKRGMVADLNVHWDIGADGSPKPHAHVMLSMREPGPDGFGKKARDWNSRELLEGWRERWSRHVNERLTELGIEARIDHRTLLAQGIQLEPQHKIGPAGKRREDRGEDAERAKEHQEIARRNGERIIAEPSVALDAISGQQSTFTDHDLARFVHRHTDDLEQFTKAMSAVKTAPVLVALGLDGRGRERYTTREMLETEARLEDSAGKLADRDGHRVFPRRIDRAVAAAEVGGFSLGEEQRVALAHITQGKDLTLVMGYAGTGKSAILGVARDAWEAEGYQVRGAALSGIAAESLEAGSGVHSRTIASLEHSWSEGRELLTSRDVLLIDEAGMIGSRQMDRVLLAAERAGAKVVLVGDPEQLQAIEAGAAFRALTEQHGAAEITEIRRQREDWQRDATRALATGRTEAALNRYEAGGMVQGYDTRTAARDGLVGGWDAVRHARPSVSQVMLAHTRADVAELNALARGKMRQAGELGDDVAMATERGERIFAAGDRIMFLRNERSLGVKNGTLGTALRIEESGLTVQLDGAGERQVQFDLKDYAHFDHGYASTIHKSQGVTVDQAHVLATGGLDRHSAYVAMSRHRDGLMVYYGADDFNDRAHLVRTLSRERAKDTTLDYRDPHYDRIFAERRDIAPAGLIRSETVVQRAGPALGGRPARGAFANFKPPAALGSQAAKRRASLAPLERSVVEQNELSRGVRNYARAFSDLARMRTQNLPVLPHQQAALQRAGDELAGISPEAGRDLGMALSRHPNLAQAIGRPGGLDAMMTAMAREKQVRLDPILRADRFVDDWKALSARRDALRDWGHGEARQALEVHMQAMAKGLGQDAELNAQLKGRRRELGLTIGNRVEGAQNLAHELTRVINRGLGLSR